jgi:hypothetical protein
MAALVAGLVASYTSAHAIALVIRGFSAIGLGTLFLLAYYFEDEFFVFHWLIVLCERHSSPRHRKWAFVYFAGFSIAGSIAVLQGLGFVGANGF